MSKTKIVPFLVTAICNDNKQVLAAAVRNLTYDASVVDIQNAALQQICRINDWDVDEVSDLNRLRFLSIVRANGTGAHFIWTCDQYDE